LGAQPDILVANAGHERKTPLAYFDELLRHFRRALP
jgi:hypothetical protein